MTDTTDRDAAPAAAEGADARLYEAWRAAVLAHERMCIEVDLYTPKDVYAAYLAARTREIEAALALRRAVAPLGLGVTGAARPAPPAAPRAGYLTALDRLEAWWRNIAGATSLPYPGWQDDVMIVLRLAREAARGEGESTP